MRPALLGVMEVRFTIVSMTISLIAVFMPILLMDGIVGRLFREFAVTISVATAMPAFVSLMVTPMLCGWLVRATAEGNLNGACDASKDGSRPVFAGPNSAMSAR